MPTPADATAAAIEIEDVKEWRGQLTSAGEKTAYAHFGMAYSPTGEGARRLAKH